MTDQIKDFFSTAFAVVSLIVFGCGLYKIPKIGLDKSGAYFIIGFVFFIISMVIEFSRAQNYDGDDF